MLEEFHTFFDGAFVIVEPSLFEEAHQILTLGFFILAVPCEVAEQVFEFVEAEILLPFLRVLVLAVLLLDVE